MDPVLDRYARRPTPRYTSYPTAPHFQTGFAEDRYRRWLSDLPPSAPVSLYLHVPFCRQMCWYCGCNMKLASKYGPVGDYAKVLRKEVALTADALPGRMTISHLHWGGRHSHGAVARRPAPFDGGCAGQVGLCPRCRDRH